MSTSRTYLLLVEWPENINMPQLKVCEGAGGNDGKDTGDSGDTGDGDW